MIYINYLFFIIAVFVFMMAPRTAGGLFTQGQNLLGLAVLFFGYWHYTRYQFSRLRALLDREEITLRQLEKYYNSRMNIQFVLGIASLALAVHVFDLKYFLTLVPIVGQSELFLNAAGFTIYFLHLFIAWYWGHKTHGDVLQIGSSPKDYIRANFKFNVAIIIPWLILLTFYDIADILFPGIEPLMQAPMFRELFFGLFLLFFALFAPIFIVRLWDCEPMPPSPLKERIQRFCRSQGVKFKSIMNWNALNKGMVTAGVMGIIAPFRYLMITPGLMSILDEDEIMAVVSHEVGHVRKKHLLLYLLFFMGFVIISGAILDWLLYFFLTTSLGNAMITNSSGQLHFDSISFYIIVISLLLLVLYVRFVFGYFIRNFERQADGYCIECGIDPDHMISSFMKLGVRVGDDGKKRNWHHFNLAQRIDYLRSAMENPGMVKQHDRTVKRRVGYFAVGLVLFAVLAFNISSGLLVDGLISPEKMVVLLEERLQDEPENTVLYYFLGQSYYQLEEWKKAKNAWEESLKLNYQQPAVLNNLAWLLLTAEDKEILDPRRALKMARDAANIEETYHIMDTLAEAYYQNEMYHQAYKAAQRALEIAPENRAYLEKQLSKMKAALKKEIHQPR